MRRAAAARKGAGMTEQPRPYLTLALVVTATLLGLMGTDLVLPEVPSLPET